MFREVTWLLAGGPLQPGLGWRRHGRFGAPGRLHFLMAIAALAVCLLPASVAHAQGAGPSFATSTYDREVAENTAAGENIGDAVTATGGTGALTYTLDVAGAAAFDIDDASGQLRTKTGVTYDHEATGSYSVMVTAADTASMTATATVAVTVTDVDEPPLPPPLVDGVGVPGTYDQIVFRWEEPNNTGRPPITSYEVEAGSSISNLDSWGETQIVQGTELTITGLLPKADYRYVRVRARNDEGASPWVVPEGLLADFLPSDFLPSKEQIYPVSINDLPRELDLTFRFGDFSQPQWFPEGIGPGDWFRFLLVTDGNRISGDDGLFFASSRNQTFYYGDVSNSTLNDNGISTLAIQTQAVVSTRLVDAREVTNTIATDDDGGVPIYWVNGNKAADDYNDFWDGNWDEETEIRSPIGLVIPNPGRVWTGSASDGTELIVNGVSHAMGQPQVGYGTPGSANVGAGPIHSGATAANSEAYRLYGLTQVIYILPDMSVTNAGQLEIELNRALDAIDENLPDREYNAAYDRVEDEFEADTPDVRALRRAQKFTTGPRPNGYELAILQMAINTFREFEDGGKYSLALYTVDGNGHPDAQIVEIENPSTRNFEENFSLSFHAPEDTFLSPNTEYAVVVTPSDPNTEVTLDTTRSDNEDADETEEGWSLADAFDIEGTGGMWSEHPEGKSLLLRVRATPTEGPPGKPADLTATAMGRHRIDLAWTAPLDGGSAITGYKIESSTDSGTTWSDLVADTQSDVASYAHTGLSPNTTVHYRVSAISALGTSSASDPANDTTDDFPEVTVQFGQASYTLAEGETVNVTISLSEAPLQETVVPITATGQGGAGPSDYSVPASVTFNAGDSEQTIAFMALEDPDDDDDESVKLGFGTTLPPRVSLGARTETTLNIGDNDNPVVTVMFTQDAHTLAEGGTQQITVTLSADPERTMIIPITATPQAPATTDDYSVPASVTFNAPETSRTIIFSAAQDRVDENSESVNLGFGTMPDPQVSAGSPDEVTLTITDDDTADIVLDPTSLAVGENTAASYTVKLATEPTVDVSVTITGHSGTDLTLNKTTLTFTDTSWDAAQTVTVAAAAGDDDGAGNDAATLTHTASGGEYANITRALPVQVEDDDTVDIVFDPASLALEESESASYAVALATQPTATVTVTISGHSGTDLTLSGTTLTNDTLTFTETTWDTVQTVTVAAASDDDSANDTAILTHTAAGGDYAGVIDTLTVLVTDDDTGALRLVDGTMTDPGNAGALSEGRLEIFYNGEWCTICDDYWGHTDDNQDVACRQLGFVGGSVEDHERFRNSYFPAGTRDQTIALDNVNCRGSESNLLDCPNRGWGVHDCRHFEDVGIRCIQNSAGAYITNMEFSAPPGTNGKYDVGETVTVTLVWSEAVNVDVTPAVPPYTGIHPPHLHLGYGRAAAPSTKAVYTGGTGATRTVFTATVEDRGSAPYDSLLVLKESLTTEIWNATPGLDPVGSYITSASTGDPATLKHPYHRSAAVGMQAGAATIPGVPTFNDPGEDNVFGPGETVEVTFTFSQPVQVDTTGGTPSVEVLLSGTDAKQARYVRGSGASKLVFGYTLTDEDGEHNSLLVDPNSLRLNGGTIRDVANNLDAATQHQGGGTVFLPPPDETAPQLQSAAVNGSSLTLAYDEELENANTLSSGLFAVNVNQVSHPVMGVAVDQTNVILLLSPAVAAADTATVDYTVPTDDEAARVQDLSGNPAESFSGQAVANDTAPEQPVEPSQTERSPQGELDILGSPTGLQVARHGSGKLVASWIAPDTGPVPTGYTVRWKESGDDWADRNDVSEAHITNGFWDIITGLTDGTEYAVRVIATRDDADSAPSGEVTVTPGETTPPELSSASVDGDTLTLTFNEVLDTGETPDGTAFTVTVGGNSRGVDAAAVSGSAVTLTLVTAVSAGETVTLGYRVPTVQSDARLQDLAGNAAVSFSGQAVTNDTAPPQTPIIPDDLRVTRHESGKLLASWTARESGPAPTGYTLQWKESGDDWADQDDVSEAVVTGTSHTITGLTDGVEYAVRVIASTEGADSDPSGEVTATPTETTPPELLSASVDGATLTLTFDEQLDTDEAPERAAFTVTVGDSDRGVDAVAMAGSAVTITLATAVSAGDAVTVDYTAPTSESASRLRDQAGNAAASFSGQSVTNGTQAAVPLTASAHDVPAAHDGSTTFTFELRFSEEPADGFSYKTLRDHAFTVTGGEVVKARRLEKGRNGRWEISVTPGGDGAVTIVLLVTTDCDASGAVCTEDGRKLSSRLDLTASGPE